MNTVMHDKNAPEVIVCQGPPACPFAGNEAVANAQAGCPNCVHIRINADGTETEYLLNAN